MFDVDGVLISKNTVTFADDATGRRGFSIDGGTDVVVEKDNLTSADGASTLAGALDTYAKAPWAIQISMSDAPVTTADLFINDLVPGMAKK